ncbi:MAG: BamA/TamA family outer membrane protein [Candidatus Cloacimonetes bacterium]|nr:BamA/TamA family outer membrane protein [Candidatus Cloacimonadota bacterium]
MKFTLFTLLMLPVCLAAQLIISQLEFEGNHRLSSRELARVVVSREGEPYDPVAVQGDTRRIAEYYASRGHYNIEAFTPRVEPGNRRVRITFVVRELEPVLLDTLHISGTHAISESRLRPMIRADDVRSLDDTDALVRRIPQLYAELGWLFARCTLDSLGWENGQAAAWVRVEEGPACRPRQWRFEGNDVTRPATILRISQADRVETLTLPLLYRMEENLRRKDYIREVEVVPLDGQTVLFRLREDRMTHVSAALGYNNDDSGDDTLTGWVRLAFLNLFGADRDLRLDWHRLSHDRSSIEMAYHESGPLRWPVAADVRLFREEVDSTFIHTTFDTEVYVFTLTQRFGVYAGVDDYMPGSRRPKLIEKASYKKVGGVWSYNGEDNLGNPSSGDAVSIRSYWIYHREDGQGRGKTATEFDLAHYQPLGFDWVLALGLHGRGYDTSDISDYERFEMGGAASLRGFIENRFAGHRLGWGSLELRRLLGRDSRTFIFADYGAVEWADAEGEHRQIDLAGVGLGLRVMTRIGQFQLDYAVGHDSEGWGAPLDGFVHFGIETRL